MPKRNRCESKPAPAKKSRTTTRKKPTRRPNKDFSVTPKNGWTDRGDMAGDTFERVYIDNLEPDDKELISFDQLSRRLSQKKIIEKSPKVLSHYNRVGIKHWQSGEHVRMRAVPIGSTRYSCVLWFLQFMLAHGSNLSRADR